MRSSGNRAKVPEMIQSTIEPMAFWKVRMELTMNGESGEVDGIFDDDPMCMLMTVSVSSQACRNGSHQPDLSCMEGRPRWKGFSVNATAWLPFSAHLRISSAARWASHKGTMVRGIRMFLPAPAHHSSIIQSL